ncbi:glycoside hydrolase family 31 protein [Luteolibacter soli]|uniref:TIM-barrel domain-containing protein n=1 Tax=Luteolibacter soli TaxID=3135280 RepID=A0ABU9AWR7_9BACT
MKSALCRMAAFAALANALHAAPLVTAGKPAELSIRVVGEGALRVTLKPLDFTAELPPNPALLDRTDVPLLRLQEITEAKEITAGTLKVSVKPDPLTVRVSSANGTLIQELAFQADGSIDFPLDDQPVLGLGEGGPMPGKNWRTDPVQFDRRGRLDTMEPHWQSDAYGSRNPVALLAGTRGWGLWFATPWGKIDLSKPDTGKFIPIEAKDPKAMRQTFGNQGKQLGKGIPPMETFVPGLLDVFVFDAREPAAFMNNLAALTGRAVMPPKWALGYMQSHRTLEDDAQMLKIVDTFREKHIPLDAVIYLGTGFTPRGWNKKQPSFEFNPEVFKRDPAAFIADVHQRNAKVVLHMVPWDRDKIPLLDDALLGSYWKEHEGLVKAGVDGWWPDEGDWFDLNERLKRHQLYYDGPISTQPDRRPWSLHRNGYLGIARWGGWVWSGDTQSTWKTLEAQIAVGINHSLSLSPYWGSDIAGFLSTPELTGELYARWFQFAAFTPSFRAHGRTWWTRLPWGWGLDSLGPVEDKEPPSLSELNNPAIEPIARKYAELRYQLLTYNYTLASQARETGLPFMRALWLHYPDDAKARGIGNEYLWGRDLLIAPVFEKGATSRETYLPAGQWYDFWSGDAHEGGSTIRRPVDLATMPIFVRAGTILPLDPIRQYTGEEVKEPLTIRIYRGADGTAQIYHDDGSSNGYLKGDSAVTSFKWDDQAGKLTIEPQVSAQHLLKHPQKLRILLIPGVKETAVDYRGEAMTVDFK